MNSIAKEDNLISDEMSKKIIATAEKIAMSSGEVTVSKILQELGITNRVFYNRFRNVEDVLLIVYQNTVMRVREGMQKDYDGQGDFFEYVVEAVAETLIASYEVKMKFNQFFFEYDTILKSNYEWYMQRINALFAKAKELGLIKDVDEKVMSYAIWCFCRGYNADAVMRMQKDEAGALRFRQREQWISRRV